MAPLVSVAISTHNRAAYLREAVASVLEQTYPNFEVILCDDASTDETPLVCQELQVSDPRVRVVRHEKNIGMQANWNSGIAAAQGVYFAKLDDDNRYTPTFLAQTVALLEADSTFVFAFADEWIIDSGGRRDRALTEQISCNYHRAALPAGVLKNPRLQAAYQGIGINAALFHLASLREEGGFGNYGAAADCELFLRLTSQGKNGSYLPERLVEYRVHGSAFTTGSKGVREADFAVQVWEKYTFTDPEAEAVRRERLSTSYLILARALALNGRLSEARAALAKITSPLPGAQKARFFRAIFSLPPALVTTLIKRKYAV